MHRLNPRMHGNIISKKMVKGWGRGGWYPRVGRFESYEY
jgi:hypothetical protein